MGSKNISITEEAYSALSREKREDESFTEVIMRLTQNSGRLADCFGTWRMGNGEKVRIFDKEIPANWKRSKDRMKEIENEMP